MKLVVEEEGSALAAELWERAEAVVASHLVRPEALAALGAAGRGGRLGEREVRAATATIGELCDAATLVGVDGELARQAGVLAQRHALRGFDAVHLATALAVEADDLVLATWDRALSTAALAAGLAVAPG